MEDATPKRPSRLKIALCVAALAGALVTDGAATASPAGAMDDLCLRAAAKIKLLYFMDDVFGIGWRTIEWEVRDAIAAYEDCGSG